MTKENKVVESTGEALVDALEKSKTKVEPVSLNEIADLKFAEKAKPKVDPKIAEEDEIIAKADAIQERRFREQCLEGADEMKSQLASMNDESLNIAWQQLVGTKFIMHNKRLCVTWGKMFRKWYNGLSKDELAELYGEMVMTGFLEFVGGEEAKRQKTLGDAVK